ncbi:MAG: membrane protein [Nitrospirales bacterium]|nr:MAG: membrane protein [Nitrospirales bacterium]
MLVKRSTWRSSRFDIQEDEPLGPLANLVDIMLVFACGLIAALAALSPELIERLTQPQVVEKGQELPQIPAGIQSMGDGYESMGQVFRDPKTGKLYLIERSSKK